MIPASGAWSDTGPLTTERSSHTATLLYGGGILAAGGDNASSLASAELYDPLSGVPAASRPQIQWIFLDPSGKLVITGTGFLGASGGSTNFPAVQLRRLDNEQTSFLVPDPASSLSPTLFTSRPVQFTPGYQMVTVIANGISSTGWIFSINPPASPADIVVEGVGLEILPDGGSQNFGTPPVNATVITNFTIRNPGDLDLTGLTITKDGPNSADFTVTSSPSAPVVRGGSTTFTVQFASTTPGAKTAAIHIASNVAGKDPFDINLTDELRKLAAQRLAGEAPGQTLQATALVHEAWMRLTDGADTGFENRGHFFAAAAEAIRRILIERARKRHALKRGEGIRPLDFERANVAMETDDDTLLVVDEALQGLEREQAVAAELVKLRFFAGMTNAEACVVLKISPRTAKRYWTFARAWLYQEIRSQQAGHDAG